jgi:RNA polymerase sigma-70 factor (ECF subfamily)
MQFETVMEEYYQYIYNFAMKLSCHPQKAEDITQETFLQVYKNLHLLRDEQAIKKWLRTICYNCFLTDCRKNSNELLSFVENVEELEQEGTMISYAIPGPEEEVVVAEEIKDMQNGCFYAMVRKLSLKQRIVFSLMDMFGMSLTETAEMVQLSENATKGLLHRARKNLDAFFSDHCNLIKEENPCSCKAWINFRQSHDDNRKKTKEIVDSIKDRGRDYTFDDHVRNKIKYLYSHMPEAKPDKAWFDHVLESLK